MSPVACCFRSLPVSRRGLNSGLLAVSFVASRPIRGQHCAKSSGSCGQVRLCALMEYVLPRSRWLRPLLRLLEPVLRTINAVTWRDSSETLLEAAGLHILDVRPVWEELIVIMIAAMPTGERRPS